MTNENIIILSPKYDKLLDVKLLSNYKKIIFSSCALSDGLFDACESNNFYYYD